MTTRTGAFRRIPFPLQHPDLRVSDAERNEVADVLAKHYGDGRLTQEEFNERVDRAMNAKTQSDLSGLLDDLPALGGAEPPRPRKLRSRGGYRPLFLLALVVTLLVVAGHGLWWFFMPHWLSVLLLIAVGIYVIRAVERRARRSDGRPGLDDRSGPHDHPGLGRRP